jgi:hypothetical protein
MSDWFYSCHRLVTQTTKEEVAPVLGAKRALPHR